jgi:hypothetical protein
MRLIDGSRGLAVVIFCRDTGSFPGDHIHGLTNALQPQVEHAIQTVSLTRHINLGD